MKQLNFWFIPGIFNNANFWQNPITTNGTLGRFFLIQSGVQKPVNENNKYIIFNSAQILNNE